MLCVRRDCLVTYRVVDVHRLFLENLVVGKRRNERGALLRITTNPHMHAPGSFGEKPHEVEERDLQARAALTEMQSIRRYRAPTC